MYISQKLTAIATVLAVSASPAFSAIIDFRNGTNGANGTYEDPVFAIGGGETVTVSAGAYVFDSILSTDVDGFADLAVAKRNAGLGVVFAGLPNLGTDINGPGDLLTFTFSAPVTVNAVLFGRVDRDDDFDLFLDGVLAASDVGISGNNPASLGGVEVSQFSIGADQVGFFRTDDFTIAKIDVEVSAVPLPAGLPLLAGGLFALGYLRRRT